MSAPPVFEVAGSLEVLDIRSSAISALQIRTFTDGSTESNLQELLVENNTCTSGNSFL